MDIIRILEGMTEYLNPYPQDIFPWDNKESITLTRGRLYKLLHNVVENTRNDLIKIVEEE